MRQLREKLIEEVGAVCLPPGHVGESRLLDALLGIRAGLLAEEIALGTGIPEIDVLRMKERLHYEGFRVPTKASKRESDVSDAKAWMCYGRSVREAEAREARSHAWRRS